MKTFKLLIYKFPIENFTNSLFGKLLLKEIKNKGFSKIKIYCEKDNLEKPDLIIFSVMDINLFFKYRKIKKVLYIFENIYYELNLLFFIIKFSNFFKIKTNFIFKNILFLKILNIKLFNFRPLNLYFVNNRLKNNSRINYVVSNNIFKSNNSFYCPDMFNKFIDSKDLKKQLLKIKTSNSIPKKFCAFLVSNPINVDRILFYKELSKYKKIDSYGKVSNNSKIPKFILLKYKNIFNNFCEVNRDLFKEYKFVISFENNYSKSHITEKLINVFLSKSIPIYKGAQDITNYFNLNSFINCNDKSYKEIIQKIIKLDNNDKAYLKMKNSKKINENFFKNYEKDFKKFCKYILK